MSRFIRFLPFSLFRGPRQSVPRVTSDNYQDALLPPGPLWSRIFLWILAGGSFSLLIWSFFAQVQDVVVLTGSLRSNLPIAKVLLSEGGYVQSVLVQPSQQVQLGQPLLHLDVTDLQAKLQSTNLRLKQLEEAHRSFLSYSADFLSTSRFELKTANDLLSIYQDLYIKGSFSYVQALQQKNRVAQLQLRVSQASHDLNEKKANFNSQRDQLLNEISSLETSIDRSTLYSPVNGVIQSLELPAPGVFLPSGSEVFKVIPSGRLFAQVKLPSRYRDSASPGMKAMIDIDSFPSREFGSITSEISSVSPSTFESSSPSIPRSYMADIQLISAERPNLLNISRLFPGMNVTARVALKTKPVVTTVFEFFDKFFDPVFQQR